jgi:HEAT repeat protein
MDESSPSTDRLRALLAAGADTEAAAYLAEFEPTEVGAALRALRPLADDEPTALTGILDELTGFLTHEERSVRLTTAKLFAAVAAADPAAVRPVGPRLVGRLGDETEFYFVRARAAEALGYLARERPDDVVTPELLADLTVGLSVDEPEVREYLAKALECVAVGDPDRLRHRVPTLVEHLDDDNAVVRYHLCSALVAVGSVSPAALDEARAALTERLDDPEPAVRGRAAEAFGTGGGGPTERLRDCRAEDAFVAKRVRFALDGESTDAGAGGPEPPLGTPESVHSTTEAAADSIRSPEGECANCGLELPEQGPPTCPKCGAPY